MGYGCYIKGGTIYTEVEETKKVMDLLDDCMLECALVKPGKIDIYGSMYQNYHEEDYEDIAKYAKKGSYIEFLGDDDAAWTLYPHDGVVDEAGGEIIYDATALGKKIRIPLGDGNAIIAEVYPESDYKELSIYLMDERNGVINQDLAVVREDYLYTSEGKVNPVHGRYTVLVYADPYGSEDYTDEFRIERYEEKCSHSVSGACEAFPCNKKCDGGYKEMDKCTSPDPVPCGTAGKKRISRSGCPYSIDGKCDLASAEDMCNGTLSEQTECIYRQEV